MSIMELDPPDYWLTNDPHGDGVRHRTWRVWAVGPLRLPSGEQVLLARVDPPFFVYGHGDQDFIVLRPTQRRVRLAPVRRGATSVDVCRYLGQYRGQETTSESDLVRVEELVLLADAAYAQRVLDYIAAHGFLP